MIDLGGAGIESRFLKTTGLFAGLLSIITGLLIFLMIEEVAENLETMLIQKAEIQAYKLVSRIEEIVLTSPDRSLNVLNDRKHDLEMNLWAIYQGDASYLYCAVQDRRGQMVFLDKAPILSNVVFEPMESELANLSDLQVQKQTLTIHNEERTVFDLAIPIVIQNQRQGILKLGISAGDQAQQIEGITDILIKRHLIGGLLIVVIGVLAIIQIIRLIREARRVEAQTQETDRLIFLGTIASGLAHEIRNPLNAISVTSELLAEVASEDGEKSRKELVSLSENIGNSVRHLNATLTSFLQFARSVPLSLTPIDLKAVALETVRSVARPCARQGILTEWEDTPEIPEIAIDVTQFKQALLNLLLNAQQAMPEGGVLRVEVKNVDREVWIDVSDTGPGIPVDQQEKIFNFFFTSKLEGSGLGLAIARKIVEAHGGRLVVESEIGEGTTFSIRLKLDRFSERDTNEA